MRQFMKLMEGVFAESEQLDELTGVKGSPEVQAMHDVLGPMPASLNLLSRKNMFRDFLDRLEEMGYRKINAGSFGAVFTHDGLDYVIKVFKDDPAYLKFVRYCVANQANPYLPKFRGRFMKLDDHHYAVRMERLSENFNRFERNATVELDKFALSNETVQACIARLQQSITTTKTDAMKKTLGIVVNNPKLLGTIAELRSLKGLFTMDLHGGNFMLREQGRTIVVVDPYLTPKDVREDPMKLDIANQEATA